MAPPFIVTAAALVDSINPCAIAVLVILLSGLVASVVPHQSENQPEVEMEEGGSQVPQENVVPDKSSPSYDEENVVTSVFHLDDGSEQGTQPESESKEGDADSGHYTDDSATIEQRRRARRAFISGMAFILSIYIAYYLLGFGIFAGLSSTATGASGIILYVLGILIIMLGLWNVKDFLFYDRGYNVEIPRSWRPALKKILGAVTSPIGAFACGFLVCLFELPCSGENSKNY